MSEQHGNQPKHGLDSSGTLRLVHGEVDDNETLAAPADSAANAAEGEPPVQQTLPLTFAQSTGNRSSLDQTSGPTSGPITNHAGTRFRHLRAWREGGLGKVYIALDEELHREVALKEIKPQHAGNRNSQERFLIEGEVTGSLEHPGIVPVYGMGRYSDGRPYYAMRFVHGESLEEAIERFHYHRPKAADNLKVPIDADAETIDATAPEAQLSTALSSSTEIREDESKDEQSERAVAFRDLLSRFIAVCNAIAYAHSRGVLHRDLKPGNILLAKYGETLVVDWGLAKVAGQSELPQAACDEDRLEIQSGTGTAPTRLGAVVGTPAFMSPEQAEGRQDLMGPASDIYSLGATLYPLLTGRCAFMDPRLDTVLQNVRRGHFPKPRQVKPDVPRALEAICLKAMSLRREERYETASALAADLEHWLADEPVSAYPERGLERAARWLRRHKSAALSAAIGLLLLAVVAVVAAVLVNRERVIADAARKNADVAFRQARDAVDDLFTKVSEDSLLNQPGLQGLRKDLLQKTLDYYKRFLEQRADDPSVQEEFAATLFRAGRIIDELQSPEKALPYLEQAQAIQQQLLGDSHTEKRLQALADTHNAMGRSLYRSQQFEPALAAFQRAVELRQQLVNSDSRNFDYQRGLANSVMNIGLIKKDLGQFDAAAEQLQAAQQLRQAQLIAGGDSAKLERDLAMGAYNQGVLEEKQNQPTAAAQHFDKAINRFEKLEASEPNDLTIQYYLGICYRKSADAHSAIDSQEEATRLYGLARDAFARLVDRNPEVAEYQSSLAGIYMNIAGHQEGADAISSFEKVRSILTALVQQYPKNPQFRRDLAVALRELGSVQIKAQDREAGRQNLRSSIEELEKLHEELPDNGDIETELEKSHRFWNEAQAPAEVQTA